MPNFTALDMSLPEVANLVAAMMRARDAVSRRSWSHPQEPTGESEYFYLGPTFSTSASASSLAAPTTAASSKRPKGQVLCDGPDIPGRVHRGGDERTR